MKTVIKQNNILCLGCANAVHMKLGTLNGVFGVKIDVEANEVVVDHTDEVTELQLVEKLNS